MRSCIIRGAFLQRVVRAELAALKKTSALRKDAEWKEWKEWKEWEDCEICDQ